MELLGKEKYNKPHPVLKIHLVKLMDFMKKQNLTSINIKKSKNTANQKKLSICVLGCYLIKTTYKIKNESYKNTISL